MLPDVLDVPAALGSDVALNLLKENGVEDYPGYMENMEKLRGGINEADDSLCQSVCKLDTDTSSLIREKGRGISNVHAK